MWRRTQKLFASLLPTLYLVFGLVLAICYLNRWDAVTALTLVPVWAWAGAAMATSLLAWIVVRGKGLVAVFVVSLLAGIASSGEVHGVLREFSRSLMPVEAPGDRPQLRLASLDLEGAADEAGLRAVAEAQPDLLLLQGLPESFDIAAFGETLHGEDSVAVAEGGLAILARGELVNSLAGDEGDVLHARIRTPGGFLIDASTLEIPRCLPRASLWNLATWVELAEIRAANRRRLRSHLGENQLSLQTTGRVIGGAFRTPPGDDLYRPLESNGMIDAHRAAGIGWGNTHPRAYPALRLDQIWVSENLEPREARARPIPGSLRRMVLADVLQRAPD